MDVRAIVLGLVALGGVAGTGVTAAADQGRPLGMFADDDDIGTVKQAGGTRYDPRSGTYRVTGNGGDLWAATDDFHFTSRTVAGDVTLTATPAPDGGSDEPHSKAGLMIREDLRADSPYADLVVHQNGLVALQYRATRGGATQEVPAPETGWHRLRLVRRGDDVAAAVAGADGSFHPLGDVHLPLGASPHVGLLVCAHSDTRTKTVDFSAVTLTTP